LGIVHFEAVIGLEIHAQLQTQTKIFCGCSTAFGAAPNTQVCPVCLGLPGALPVLNRQAVDYAVTAALGFDCAVQSESVFARKNYFYPDLPKGYQISQYERPIALGGHVPVTVGGVTRRIGLTRIHMEEDAGKSLHEGFPDSERKTYLDYNRSGVPLIEIVSEPELRTAAEAAAFFAAVHETLVALGVNDGNMEEGSLRCDANVSVRPAGQLAFGTRAEVKNLNSFRYLQKAVEYEIERQVDVIEQGGRVVQETRLFDSSTGQTHSMRSKEEAHDYRYFPEPDLPPLRVDEARIARIRSTMRELPRDTTARLVSTYGIPAYDADVLLQKGLAARFEATVRELGVEHAKVSSNTYMSLVSESLNERGETAETFPITPADLAALDRLVIGGTISSAQKKTVFAKMRETGRTADDIVKAEGLAQNNDEGALVAIVRDVIAANADAAAQYRAGSPKTFGFLVGQVMKASGGKANPKLANEILRRELESS
jgi:aspartyl-tRNA(Asn)/glutamyl-tRNA(Gln) amidotransferase subunit B